MVGVARSRISKGREDGLSHRSTFLSEEAHVASLQGGRLPGESSSEMDKDVAHNVYVPSSNLEVSHAGREKTVGSLYQAPGADKQNQSNTHKATHSPRFGTTARAAPTKKPDRQGLWNRAMFPDKEEELPSRVPHGTLPHSRSLREIYRKLVRMLSRKLRPSCPSTLSNTKPSPVGLDEERENNFPGGVCQFTSKLPLY